MPKAENQYSFAGQVSTGGDGHDFGFPSERVRLINRGGVPLHYSLDSSAATTGDPELLHGQVFDGEAETQVAGVISTSTTTSTAGEDKHYQLSAWGG